ncbi:MAG: hypothetical protein GPOALKHO_000607 [Sodalis sp.]|nr:MAG: hypothetical protein GPOALKHO_000607 [Sodalis sp.]
MGATTVAAHPPSPRPVRKECAATASPNIAGARAMTGAYPSHPGHQVTAHRAQIPAMVKLQEANAKAQHIDFNETGLSTLYRLDRRTLSFHRVEKNRTHRTSSLNHSLLPLQSIAPYTATRICRSKAPHLRRPQSNAAHRLPVAGQILPGFSWLSRSNTVLTWRGSW